MSAAKRKFDPTSRRTAAAKPEDVAVNQAVERIVALVCSGRSAYVWCSEGPLVDRAIRRAGERIDECRFIEIGPVQRGERSTYSDSFCSELGYELYGDDQLKKRDLLKKLQENTKMRIVISITHRMLDVQEPLDFANWLGYFIGELERLNVIVIFGARKPHGELEALLNGRQLPFEADQEVAIDFKDEVRNSHGEGLEKKKLPQEDFRVVKKKRRSGGESSLKECKIGRKIRLLRGGCKNKLQYIEIESVRLKITAVRIWEVIDSALRSAKNKVNKSDFVKFDYETKKIFRTDDAQTLLKKFMEQKYDPQGKIVGIRFKDDYLQF